MQFVNSSRLVWWPAQVQLMPGAVLEWPLLLHPMQAGELGLRAVWQYEACPASQAMPVRTLRWSCALNVQPLLQLRASLFPSANHLSECILHLQVQQSEVRLSQFTCHAGW